MKTKSTKNFETDITVHLVRISGDIEHIKEKVDLSNKHLEKINGRLRTAENNITSIKTYKDSKLCGKYIEYYTSTKKRVEGTMQYNMMQDKWTFWYHNGQKELECEFEFGEPVGTPKLWNDNGKRRFTYDLGSWNDEV